LSLWLKLKEEVEKIRNDISEVASDIEVKRVEVNKGTVTLKV
jgi:hypothetical protein